MPKSKLTILNENSNERDQILFELSPEAIILLDDKGRVFDANQRLEDWLGYLPKEIIGKHVSKLPFLSKKSKMTAVAQFTKRMAGGKIKPYDIEFTAKDNSIVIGSIKATIIKDDKGKSIADLVMISDVTRERKSKIELKENTKELERLNKLMIGREEKMYELKNKLKDKNTINKDSLLQLFKKRINVLKEVFIFQVMIGVITGTYASLLIFLFLNTNISLAIFITGSITFLCVSIVITSLLLQKKISLSIKKGGSAMLNLLEDISEEKKYKETQSKSILENIGEAIVITNEKGLVEYVNPSFDKLLNCHFDESIVGKDFAEEIKMSDLSNKEIPVYERSDSAAITAKNQEMQVIIKCKKGKQKIITINAAPVRINDQFKGVVRIIHDISEEFNLQQQKDDFFSIASHELRTPLTVIAGNVDTILQGYGKSKLSKDDKSLLMDVESATSRLIKMVNEFLNVSRIDQGRLKVNIAPLDICKITEDVVKEIKPLTDKKSLYLEYSCPKDHVIVKADEGFLKEILINLIGNSIKFTKKGGIKINLKVKKKFLIATITDTGMGIAQNKHKVLFARFQQAMNRTMSREAGGTGLGLYISREFARVMGGDLILESSIEGKGSSFSFNLPLVQKGTKPVEVNS